METKFNKFNENHNQSTTLDEIFVGEKKLYNAIQFSDKYYNEILDIEKLTVEKYPNLEEIYLKSCNLDKLPELSNFGKLKSIRLTDCNTKNTLILPSYLRDLTLNGCKNILKIDLSGCYSLNNLSIADTNINTLDLRKNRSLEMIRASNSKLEKIYLPKKIYPSYLDLRCVYLSNFSFFVNVDIKNCHTIKIVCENNDVKKYNNVEFNFIKYHIDKKINIQNYWLNFIKYCVDKKINFIDVISVDWPIDFLEKYKHYLKEDQLIFIKKIFNSKNIISSGDDLFDFNI